MRIAIITAIVITVLGFLFAGYVGIGAARMVNDANNTTKAVLEDALR